MNNRIGPSREYRGITRENLAEQLGVTAETLASWEDGETSPSPEQAIELSRILTLPLDFLFCVNSPDIKRELGDIS